MTFVLILTYPVGRSKGTPEFLYFFFALHFKVFSTPIQVHTIIENSQWLKSLSYCRNYEDNSMVNTLLCIDLRL